MEKFKWLYQLAYGLFGGIGLLLTIILALSFQHFKEKQNKLKSWLSKSAIGYFMHLLSLGARRKIFVGNAHS